MLKCNCKDGRVFRIKDIDKFYVIDIPVIIHVFYKNNIPSIEIFKRQIEVLNGDYDNSQHTVYNGGLQLTQFKDLGYKKTKPSNLPSNNQYYTEGNKYINIRFHLYDITYTIHDEYSWNSFSINYIENNAYIEKILSTYVEDEHLHLIFFEDPFDEVAGIATIPEIDYIDNYTYRQIAAQTTASLPYFIQQQIPVFDGGNVLIHEIGHNFGLYHTFQGECTINNGADGSGDYVDDTPAQRFVPSLHSYVSHLDTPEENLPNTCSTAGKDPVFNYMGYNSDDTTYGFTDGQMKRMHYHIKDIVPNVYINHRMKFCNRNYEINYKIQDVLENLFSLAEIYDGYDYTNPENNLTPNNSIILRDAILIGHTTKSFKFNHDDNNSLSVFTTSLILTDTLKQVYQNFTKNIEFNSENISLQNNGVFTHFSNESEMLTYLNNLKI